MDTMVIVYGVLKNPIKVYNYWWGFFPVVKHIEYEKCLKFSVTHDTIAQLFPLCNEIMTKIITERGISVVRDEGLSAKDPSNLQFWPMENFQYVSVRTHLLSAKPNTGAIN
jgi:hypothetical protein